MRQLTAQDAAFLYLESQGAHLHLTALYIYDQSTVPGGVVRHKDILKHIESRLHTSPIFRQKLESLPLSVDYPYWVDDESFDLEFHVRHIALPEPRDWRQLCILFARIHSRRLDLSRPAWEMHIVEGLDNLDGIPKGAFAIIAKYHHAAIDGATGSEILGGLHDTSPEFNPDPPIEPWEPEPRPSFLGLMFRAAVNNVKAPLQLAKAVSSTLPGLSQMLVKGSSRVSHRSDSVPKTRFNEPVSPHRVFHGIEFDLKELAAIRKAIPGATVNDVVLTICGGALREYLDAKGELPDESLVAMAPVNTRLPGEDSAGNVLAIMFVAIHTDIAEPLARLRAVHEKTADAKETSNAVSARQMTDISRHIPSSTEALAGRLITGLGLGYRAMRLCNCTVTNVPGPQVPLYLNGAKLITSTGAGPVLDGMGLIVSAISYNGSIAFSFTACRETVPDPEFLSECARRAYEALKKAAHKKTAARKKVGKKTARKKPGPRAAKKKSRQASD